MFMPYCLRNIMSPKSENHGINPGELKSYFISQPEGGPQRARMNWRLLFIAFPVLIVVFLLLGVASYLHQSQSKSIEPSSQVRAPAPILQKPVLSSNQLVSWDLPAGTIPQGVQRDLQNALNALPSKQLVKYPGSEYLTITSADVSGSWVILDAEEHSRIPSVQVTEVAVLLGHKGKSGWKITTMADPGFCQIIKQMPNALVSPTDKVFYGGCFQ